jgi:parallel beta-helix repeat protein
LIILKGEKIMNKKLFYAAVILLSFLAVGIQPALAVINIPGDTDYYDEVGTHTYVLNQDVSDTIILSNPNVDLPGTGVEGDRITFDGGGYTISTPVSFPNYGISFNQSDTSKNGYITIQNINITDCDNNGIDIVNATRINVNNTNISSCRNNGIWISIAGTCIIRDNTISDCDEYGISLSGGVNNIIYDNNFINNDATPQAIVAGGSGNVFDLNGSGNFWSDYTGVDENDDGIGDTPYTFTGGQDNFPLVPPPTPEEAILELVDFVVSLNLHHGIENSLDAKLNAALNALDDMNENNDVAAIKSLNAFISAVQAQSGKKIPEADANVLTAEAQEIIDLILAE